MLNEVRVAHRPPSMPLHVSSSSGSTCKGVWVAPQEVVDFLYQLLADSLFIMKVLSRSNWGHHVFIWGSHLGATRDKGLIPWDVDLDMAIIVKKGVSREDVWRACSAHYRALGYRTVQADSREDHRYKVCPSAIDEAAACHFRELQWHVRREAIGAGTKLSKYEITPRASALQARGFRPPEAHGIHVLDVELYEDGDEIGLYDVRKPVPRKELRPVRRAAFGPLRIPIPASDRLLSKMYPGGWRKRMVRHPVTKKWSPAPRSLPRCALPSRPVKRRRT